MNDVTLVSRGAQVALIRRDEGRIRSIQRDRVITGVGQMLLQLNGKPAGARENECLVGHRQLETKTALPASSRDAEGENRGAAPFLG